MFSECYMRLKNIFGMFKDMQNKLIRNKKKFDDC